MNFPRALLLAVAALDFAAANFLAAQTPQLPAIPTNTFNITNYGAVADGKTLATDAIQKTIGAASAAGGGTVLVPDGNFLTGPFTLASGINLHLSKGATILFNNDIKTYPHSGGRYQDCISVNDAHDIAITGNGTIDGQGQPWWEAFEENHNMTRRPNMIRIANCSSVLVKDIHIVNSPCFHLVPQNCTDVTIQHITIQSPPHAHNTDGIDPSGWNYLITDCTIDAGDDNIAIKPNRSRNPGNKNYLIKNCAFLSGHGMSIGSATDGGIEDVTVKDCTFDQTDAGIRIKTSRGRGGLLQNITYENLTMNAVKFPIYINDWYPENTAPKDPATEKPEPVNNRTPINKNINIINLTATNCPNAGIIRGLPEAPIENMVLSNVTIYAAKGMKIYHAKGIHFENSKIHVPEDKPVTTYDAEVTGLE